MGRWHNEELGETRVTVDGSPLDRKLATLGGWQPEDAAAQATADDVPVKPKRSDSKAAWAEFAVKVAGLDEATAESMTRDQLADQYADV